jgi:hypothetical protein
MALRISRIVIDPNPVQLSVITDKAGLTGSWITGDSP